MAKAKAIIDTVYIFSNGPFPNLENTFDGAVVTTHAVPKGKTKDSDIRKILTLQALRQQFYTDYAVVLNPSDEAMTMAGLSAPEGAYIARIRTANDAADLEILVFAIGQLMDLGFIPRTIREFNSPFMQLDMVAGKEIDIKPTLKSNKKAFATLQASQAVMLEIAWDYLDKRFKVNK